MEQTLVFEQTIEDYPADISAPDLDMGIEEEVYDNSWGDELYELVSSHQDEMVICPWMDNAEVTLGDAMTAYEYPPNLTAEDEPFLISVVSELLNNRVIMEDEPEDLIVDPEEEPAPELIEIENLEEPDDEVAEDQALTKRTFPTVSKTQSSIPRLADLQKTEKTSASTVTDNLAELEASPTITIAKSSPLRRPEQARAPNAAATEGKAAVNIKQPKAKTRRPREVIEGEKAKIPEVAPSPKNPGLAAEVLRTGLEEEVFDYSLEPLALENPREASSTKQDLEVERLIALAEEAASFSVNNLTDAIENQAMVPISDNLAPEEFDSNEEDVAADPPPTYELDGEATVREAPFASTEYEKLEPVLDLEPEDDMGESRSEIDVVINKILAEHTENTEPQNTEAASFYLDKIVEIVAEVQSSDEEGISEDAKAAELEELFTELLDEMGVSHTPEIIENLISRIMEQDVAIAEDVEDEETAEDTQSAGLKTVVKNSSGGHVILNDVVISKRLISKVALELCGFKLSLSLN